MLCDEAIRLLSVSRDSPTGGGHIEEERLQAEERTLALLEREHAKEQERASLGQQVVQSSLSMVPPRAPRGRSERGGIPWEVQRHVAVCEETAALKRAEAEWEAKLEQVRAECAQQLLEAKGAAKTMEDFIKQGNS